MTPCGKDWIGWSKGSPRRFARSAEDVVIAVGLWIISRCATSLEVGRASYLSASLPVTFKSLASRPNYVHIIDLQSAGMNATSVGFCSSSQNGFFVVFVSMIHGESCSILCLPGNSSAEGTCLAKSVSG